MLDVTELARRIGTAVGRPSRPRRARPRVNATQVLAYLSSPMSEHGLGPATCAQLDRELATLPRVVVETRLVRRHRGFARYFDALPRIAFLYRRGHMPDEIAEQMPFLASGYGVEAVLRLVAERVAERVSRA